MKNILTGLAVLLSAAFLLSVSCARNESVTPEATDPFMEAQDEALFETVLMKVDDQIDREIAMLEKFSYSISAKKSARKIEIPKNHYLRFRGRMHRHGRELQGWQYCGAHYRPLLANQYRPSLKTGRLCIQ
jgi:hypothetical protein